MSCWAETPWGSSGWSLHREREAGPRPGWNGEHNEAGVLRGWSRGCVTQLEAGSSRCLPSEVPSGLLPPPAHNSARPGAAGGMPVGEGVVGAVVAAESRAWQARGKAWGRGTPGSWC